MRRVCWSYGTADGTDDSNDNNDNNDTDNNTNNDANNNGDDHDRINIDNADRENNWPRRVPPSGSGAVDGEGTNIVIVSLYHHY